VSVVKPNDVCGNFEKEVKFVNFVDNPYDTSGEPRCKFIDEEKNEYYVSAKCIFAHHNQWWELDCGKKYILRSQWSEYGTWYFVVED